MPPGHTEAILIYKDGEPVTHYYDKDNNKKEAFVNRWEEGRDEGSQFDDDAGWDNRKSLHFQSKSQLDDKIEKSKYNRAMDLNLDSDQIESFLNSTSLEGGLDYNFMENNCADGVCRAFGLDPDKVGGTFGTQWVGTEPQQVFSQLQENYKGQIENPVGEQMSREDFVKRAATLGAGNVPGTGGAILQSIVAQQVADPSSLLNTAGDVYKAGRYVKQTAEDLVKNSKDLTGGLFDLDVSPSKAWSNTKKWWGLKEGGQLPTAQNGNGRYSNLTSKYGSYNQWNQSNDKSFRAPIQSAYLPMNLGARGNVIGAVSTLVEGAGRLFGGKDRDGDGLMDGAFRDNKAKRKRHKARKQLEKSQNYDYKVTVDPNDPTKYVDSSTNLYNASKKTNLKIPFTDKNIKIPFGKKRSKPLQTADGFNSKLTGDNTYADFNTKTNRYDVSYVNPDFISKNKKLRPDNSINDLNKRREKLDTTQQNTFNQLAEDADAFNVADDIPEGTTFGMNEDGQSTYYAPDAQTEEEQTNYYNTMMMKKFGGHMQEGGQPSPEEMAMMQAQQEQAPQQQAPQEGGEEAVVQLMEEIKGALEGGAQPQEVMVQLIQSGMPPESVAQVFVQLGMPKNQIGPAIEQAMTQAQGQQGAEPSEEEMMAAQQSQAGAPAPPMMRYGGGDSLFAEAHPLSAFAYGGQAQDETEIDPAQFAAEQDAYAASQGDPMAQQMMEESNPQGGSGDLIQEVLAALSQGVGPEQVYTKIMEMGIDQEQAGQIIQQAMAMMNQGGPSNEAPAEDDGYAQMLSQLQDQRDSFKNEYRRDVNKLGGGASMQNAQNGTGRVAKSDTTKFLPREKTSAIFDEMVMQGYSPEEARNNIYNMNVISEKDYDFVRGLGAKKKKLKKRGGQSDSLELTTKQIAQIMAAGGSVKYV